LNFSFCLNLFDILLMVAKKRASGTHTT
jgi:hypothetical protein